MKSNIRSGLQIGRILLDGETWEKVDSSPNALPISKRCGPIWDHSVYTLACIMDLSTCSSTSWAGLALFSGSHMHLNAFICSHALTQKREFRQIQGNDDPLILLALSCSLPICAMLVWHHLSLIRLGFLFLLPRTKDRLFASFLSLFSYPLSAHHPNWQRASCSWIQASKTSFSPFC